MTFRSKILKPILIASVVLGIAACSSSKESETLGAEKVTAEAVDAGDYKTAIFAGGCFWCVESDFDKIDGVVETISGYTGGATDSPTYKQVSYTDTGHYEAVKVTYNPSTVDYETLVSFFFRHVDPTDASGQFCDKGDSYRTAVFVSSPEERKIAEDEIKEIDASGILPVAVVTPVLDASTFWDAEDYHQDYYLKNSTQYRFYRSRCGRDKRVKALWGSDS